MSDAPPESEALDGFDPDERTLCPDDACIGVLDSAGRCKVCGRQGTAAVVGARTAQSSPELAILPGAAAESALVDLALAPELAAAESALVDPPVAADADSDDFADRRLCADPGCIGVLDAAGRCKECGRVADAASSEA